MEEIFKFFRDASNTEFKELFGVEYYTDIFDNYTEFDIMRMIMDYIHQKKN